MTFSDQFVVDGDAVGPAPWMQLRLAASEETPSVSKSYDPSDGWAKNDLLQTVTASFTNNTPVDQWVYGLVSKSGSQVTLQCRSRGYLAAGHGYQMGGDPDDIATIEVSRFGCGADIGNGGLLATGGAFGINEIRQHSHTAPFMPHITGWFPVAPGETFHARVDVRFISERWENTQIDGGDADTESKVITGGLRLDLFALPNVGNLLARLQPIIVGGAANVTHDVNIDNGVSDTRTSVPVPAGVVAGDILMAIVVNNLGLSSDIDPVEPGWTLAHARNLGLTGFGDVHAKFYLRTATGSEPANYRFENGFLAEETAILMAIRGAAPYEADIENWYFASALSRNRPFNELHTAPSIKRDGQKLLAVSFFAHAPSQAPITQTPPDGMTELVDLPASGTAVAIAYMDDPPNPTGTRTFVPSKKPTFTGHSITVAILIPGEQNF